jgi:hypothetical protein
MRHTKIAAVAVTILSLGIMSVAALTTHPGSPDEASRAVSAPAARLTSSAAALETFYVPAQIVNQATEIEEQPVAF